MSVSFTKPFLFLAGFLCLISCNKTPNGQMTHISEALQITKLNDHSYIHTSYISLKNGATFPSNGFIYTHANEAFIFDTPATDQATSELIHWLQVDMNININGVVLNHFHDDCIEGIDVFKEKGIATIASSRTKELMLIEGHPAPDQVFDHSLELKLGNKTIENSFFGEAHTTDNIVSYFPKEKILFGGCMIKSLDAKKGNLADANLLEWSNTVSKIGKAYPDLEIVIPGHGDHGDQNLLEYTIQLFKTE